MSAADVPVPRQLRVRRRIAAAPAEVWEAWTTEAGLARWWWSAWDDTTYSVDLRVGGAYEIAVPSVGIGVSGEFVVLDPPRRVEMTWVWTDEDGVGPVERVVVAIEPDGDGASVTVDHSGPWTSAESVENYRVGWNDVVDVLVRVGAG